MDNSRKYMNMTETQIIEKFSENIRIALKQAEEMGDPIIDISCDEESMTITSNVSSLKFNFDTIQPTWFNYFERRKNLRIRKKVAKEVLKTWKEYSSKRTEPEQKEIDELERMYSL